MNRRPIFIKKDQRFNLFHKGKNFIFTGLSGLGEVMSIMPEGEGLRRAVKWISEQLKYESEKSIDKLISEAGVRFDLAPNETAYLVRCYEDKDCSPPS